MRETPATNCDPDVELAPSRIDLVVIGLELDDNLGVRAPERGEPRHQPHLGEGLDGDELQRPGIRASTKALGGPVESGEGVLDLDEQRLSTRAQGETVRLALEQLDPEVLLKRPDTMGNGAGRHAEFACRLRETLVPPGHFEETDRFERRSADRLAHGSYPHYRCIVVLGSCPPRTA